MRDRVFEFIRFCIVGGIVVVVDFLLLTALVASGLTDAIARVFSIALAMQLSYLLNRRFTYGAAGTPFLTSWLAFMSSNILTCCLNYAVFMGVLVLAMLPHATANRVLAIVIATAVSLPFNYWANRRFAFRKERPDA